MDYDIKLQNYEKRWIRSKKIALNTIKGYGFDVDYLEEVIPLKYVSLPGKMI